MQRDEARGALAVVGAALVWRSGDRKRELVDFSSNRGAHCPMAAYWHFRLLQETFADPALVARRRYREAVLGYLESPTISPLAFRLTEPDPERASRVFRRVLRRPGFSWERDGEALLRQYNASWFERPVLPSVTPISRALSDHHQGPRRPSSGRSSGGRA